MGTDAVCMANVLARGGKSKNINYQCLSSLPQEIDAITTQPSTDDAATSTPPRPGVNSQQPTAREGSNQQSTGADFQYNTQYSLAGGNCAMLKNRMCLFDFLIVTGLIFKTL